MPEATLRGSTYLLKEQNGSNNPDLDVNGDDFNIIPYLFIIFEVGSFLQVFQPIFCTLPASLHESPLMQISPSPCHYYFLGPNIVLGNLFIYILNQCSPLNIYHPHTGPAGASSRLSLVSCSIDTLPSSHFTAVAMTTQEDLKLYLWIINVRNQAPCPYQTKDKIIVCYIFIFIFNIYENI
jgi:hypothetical protein